uniref:PICALM-interacting mitotic regulator n=1 Tax=Leptobrachium leishanense TaxID=445787 RepID=A0A8C5LQW8_9ANUR
MIRARTLRSQDNFTAFPNGFIILAQSPYCLKSAPPSLNSTSLPSSKIAESQNMSSILQNVGWRNHNLLENMDDSPQPDKFRKRSSSSSLNTVRMSLRKRMPLKQVDVNLDAVPEWDSVASKHKAHPMQAVSLTAKNMFGSVSQKLKKTRQSKKQYLLASPSGVKSSRKHNGTPERAGKCSIPRMPTWRKLENSSPRTRTTPKSSKSSTPKTRRASGCQWKSFSNLVGIDGSNLRRSVRTASLKSPYSSPATLLRRRQFDKDLDSVSTGIRQLKRLSRVFDDAILKEERKEAILNYHCLMASNLRCLRQSRLSWRRSTRRHQHTLGGWPEIALNSIVNSGAR